jgi:glutamine synthetase type III
MPLVFWWKRISTGIYHQRSFGEQHYVFQLFFLLHGEALDYKTPLLRALQVMDEAGQMFVNILIKCKESDCYSRMGARIL